MKLDLSNAWSDAAGLLRGHVDVLVALAGVFLFLPQLARALLFPYDPVATDLAARIAEINAYFSAHWGKLLLVAIIQAFGQAAIVTVLTDRDRPTVAEGLGRALPLLPWYFLTAVIVYLILVAGLFALIIPAAYLLGRVGIAPVLTVAERRRNPFDAIRRTWQLTAGNGWRTFFLIALVWVVGSVVVLAATMIVGLVTLLAVGQTATGSVIIAITAALFSAILSLVLLLLYIGIYRQLGHVAQTVSVPSTSGT